jgi:hypothetical protein
LDRRNILQIKEMAVVVMFLKISKKNKTIQKRILSFRSEVSRKTVKYVNCNLNKVNLAIA